MPKGKLTVTLVYSYDTNSDDYDLQQMEHPAMMAQRDIEDDPSIVLNGGDWVVKAATFEAADSGSTNVCPHCGHSAPDHSNAREEDYACLVEGCKCYSWLPSERANPTAKTSAAESKGASE